MLKRMLIGVLQFRPEIIAVTIEEQQLRHG